MLGKCQWPWNPKVCDQSTSACSLIGSFEIGPWGAAVQAASSVLLDGRVWNSSACLSLHPSNQLLREASQLLPTVHPQLGSNRLAIAQGILMHGVKNGPNSASAACCSPVQVNGDQTSEWRPEPCASEWRPFLDPH